MNLTNLDLDTLRTLILTADLASYNRAAERLNRTPSAISLQMKRLQQDVGATLFRKHGRRTALTEAGEIVLRYARQMLTLNDELLDTIRGASLQGSIRIGFSQDFADTILPIVLSRFTHLYPLVQLELRIEGNAALVEAVENGQLDLALAVGQADRPTARTIGRLDLVWIAGKEFTPSPTESQPLPLVLLGPQCAFRKQALHLLDQRTIPYRIAATSPSLAGLWAAASGGLGITLRTALGLPANLNAAANLFDLPYPGHFPVTLHIRPTTPTPSVERLHILIFEVTQQHLPPPTHTR